jgi:hypothetical protein
MVCTSITVTAPLPPPLVITSINASPSANPSYPASEGWFWLNIAYTGTLGSWRIIDNGTVILANGTITPVYIQLSPGTHNLCVEAN